MRTNGPKRGRRWIAWGAFGFLALGVAGVWGLSPRPRFSWEGRLPSGYRLWAKTEPGLLFAARTGQPADRLWIYDAPDDLPHTLAELRRLFPRARVRAAADQTVFTFDGDEGPALYIRKARVGSDPVAVFARSEKVHPGPLLSLLGHIVPVREPKLEMVSR